MWLSEESMDRLSINNMEMRVYVMLNTMGASIAIVPLGLGSMPQLGVSIAIDIKFISDVLFQVELCPVLGHILAVGVG